MDQDGQPGAPPVDALPITGDVRSRMLQRFIAPDESTLTPHHRELRRVAAALRRMNSSLIRPTTPVEELAAIADAVEAAAEHLEQWPHGTMYEGFAEAANAGQDPHASFEHSPFLGLANPLAPPMSIQLGDDEVVRGEVTFGAAYEGPPGCVHGGYVAAIFDEVLGTTQSIGGPPGMTGRLTIHYRSPTPLHVPLRLEGRLVKRDGRKIFTEGALYAGDRLCAEAEGLFISIDLAKWLQLKAAREAEQSGVAD
jgi:acyl-coenzyme A thioesterase PaaI-like protein